MNKQSSLRIRLIDAGNRVKIDKVIIDVVFFCSGQQRYQFDAGETDQNGELVATYDVFDRARKDNQSFALMDYNTELEDCDEIVRVHVPSLEELSQRLSAVQQWFPANAAHLAARINKSNNGRIVCDDLSLKIEASGITEARVQCRVATP